MKNLHHLHDEVKFFLAEMRHSLRLAAARTVLRAGNDAALPIEGGRRFARRFGGWVRGWLLIDFGFGLSDFARRPRSEGVFIRQGSMRGWWTY